MFGRYVDWSFRAYVRGRTPAGLVAEENRVVSVAGDAYSISGVGIVARNNVAINSGFEAVDTGFEVTGDGHSLEGNSARGSHGHGFKLDGDNHQAINNDAIKNAGSGFAVQSGSGVLLDGNRATNNFKYGFVQRSGVTGAVTYTGNQAVGNRQAFCNDLGFAAIDGGGNNFTVVPAGACDARIN